MANYYIETRKVSGKMGTAYIKMGSETYELANIKELVKLVFAPILFFYFQ